MSELRDERYLEAKFGDAHRGYKGRVRRWIEEEPVAKSKSIYAVHPGVLMTQKWIASLKEKTERSFDKGLEAGDPELYLAAAEGYVEAMFAGRKAALRPMYEALLKLGSALGKDVRACPCETIVPLYRKHVFAEIKPATNARIDFGLALGDAKKLPKRLIDTGELAKKNRITHRFAITAGADIDDEVQRWAKAAYDRDL